MSELYTVINLPKVEGDKNNWSGLGHHGRQTRSQMIYEAKRAAYREIEVNRRILAASDEEFIVKIVRGVHVQHLVEELEP